MFAIKQFRKLIFFSTFGMVISFPLFNSAFNEPVVTQPGELVADQRPKEIQNVKIQEKLGHKLDLGLKFTDESGKAVVLGDFFDGKTPVILSPVYFSCPGLCNFHLNGLIEGLKQVDLSAGNQFKVLAVSFDSKEKHDLAKQKKDNYMKSYERPGTENGWSFLTGDESEVKTLMQSIGFNYEWNESAKEWAHASAAIMVSPEGVVTRYLPGIIFEPKDLRLGILESSKGKIGSFIDQLVLYCFKYNPHQSRYTIYVFNIMKLGGALMMLVLALWIFPYWIRSRRQV